MRLQHSFAIAHRYFTPEECDRIVAVSEALEKMEAKTRYDPKNDQRKSEVAWLKSDPETKWIYDKMMRCVLSANRQFWSWKITTCETFQYTLYKPEGFYTWHTDQREAPYEKDSRWPGMLRKLSITCQLSEPDDYEGGIFLLEETQRPPDNVDKRIKKLTNARERGTVIVFPSHLFHRVTAVESGLRRSLVGWFLGPPFV